MPVTNRTWNFINAIENATDERTVLQHLLDGSRALGFRWAFGGLVPMPTVQPKEIQSHVLFQELPDEWITRYNEKYYALRDPVVHYLQRARSPFTWEDSYTAETERNDVKLIKGEASTFGLRAGYVVPVHLLGGILAAVSFGAGQFELDPGMLAELAFAANFAIGHLFRLRYKPVRSEQIVTPRERECILWASDGKTDWEISIILGISRPTVVKHLLSAREKLGAVNRTHLIGEAIRSKLIR